MGTLQPLPRGDFRQHQEQVLQAACLHIKVASPDYLSCGDTLIFMGQSQMGVGWSLQIAWSSQGRRIGKGSHCIPLCCLLSLKCSPGVEMLEFPSPNKQHNSNPVGSRSQGFPCPEVPNQVFFSSCGTLLTVFTIRSSGWWLGTAQALIPGIHPEAQS